MFFSQWLAKVPSRSKCEPPRVRVPRSSSPFFSRQWIMPPSHPRKKGGETGVRWDSHGSQGSLGSWQEETDRPKWGLKRSCDWGSEPQSQDISDLPAAEREDSSLLTPATKILIMGAKEKKKKKQRFFLFLLFFFFLFWGTAEPSWNAWPISFP